MRLAQAHHTAYAKRAVDRRPDAAATMPTHRFPFTRLLGQRKPGPVTPLQLVLAKREHAARLANQRGAAGEQLAIEAMTTWRPRPSGRALLTLLSELDRVGKRIRSTSFDAVHVPANAEFSFADANAVRELLPQMTFIEIKSASQERVKPGFSGFFFALTEGEIAAADVLGKQHRVALFNRRTGELLLTSVPEILGRAKSSTWQLSVQL